MRRREGGRQSYGRLAHLIGGPVKRLKASSYQPGQPKTGEEEETVPAAAGGCSTPAREGLLRLVA